MKTFNTSLPEKVIEPGKSETLLVPLHEDEVVRLAKENSAQFNFPVRI